MACHEIAALRLGLMGLLGINDPQEKEHELLELGDACKKEGPIKALSESNNLDDLKKLYSISLVELQEKVLQADTKDLPYYNTLIVLTKKVEQDLQNQIHQLNQLYQDLDEIHHFVHEVYPPSQ